jgi:cardiolipin synthase
MSGRLAMAIERAIVDSGRQPRSEQASEISAAIALFINSETSHDTPSLITASVLDGIHRASDRIDRVRVAVTGTGWVGGGVGSVEETMLSVLKQAKQEILGTAYTITPGSSRIIDQIEHAAATGVRTKLVIDHLEDQDAAMRDRLRSLAREFSTSFHLYDFGGVGGTGHLHAKTLVVDRRLAVVGSANMTFHGMMTAHELAIVVEGPAAEQIAGRIDLLLQSSAVHLISS